MTGQEGLIALTLAFKGFQFGGHIDGAVAVVTDVEGNDTNGVAGNQELVALLIVEYEGENTAEVFEEVDALLTIESEDNLTVRTRLKLVLSGKAAADLLMVIDLAVHSQNLLTVWAVKRLAARLRVDDAQSLVGEDGRATTIDTTPVRSAVTDLLTHLQCFITQSMRLLLDI